MPEDRALIQSLLDLEIPNSIKFSPDGEELVYSTGLFWDHTKGDHAVTSLWHARTGVSHSSHRLTSGEFNDRAPSWHPDGKRIAFVSDRAAPGRSSAIYWLSISQESPATPITPPEKEQYISTWAFSPDGKSIAYVSADEQTAEQRAEDEHVQVWGANVHHLRLRVVHLESGETKSLKIDRSVFGLDWSPNGRQIGLTTFISPELEDRMLHGSKISTVDVETLSAVHDVCEIPSEALSIVWAADGLIYFHAAVPIGSFARGWGVYRTDPTASLGGYDLVNFGSENDVAGLANVGGRVVAKLEAGLEGRISLLEGQVLYGEQQELEAFDVVFHENQIHIAVATSNINNPVEVFTTTNDSNTRQQVSNHGQDFESRRFGSCNFLKVASADHQCQFDAMYLTPPSVSAQHGRPLKSLPTVLLIHGGPNTRLTNSLYAYYLALGPYLLSQGYGILIPNYRGSSGRGYNFASLVFGVLGEKDYADVVTCTQYAIEQGYADPDRLLVCGFSHGGFLAVCSSLRNGLHGLGWKFKAAVAAASWCDMDSMASTSDIGALYPCQYFDHQVSWTMDREDTHTRMASPIWEFSNAVARSRETGEMVIPPLLIIHGERDARCHISHAQALKKAMRKYGLPFEYVTYPKVSHFGFEQQAVIDLVLRVGKWCKTYIGEGEQN